MSSLHSLVNQVEDFLFNELRKKLGEIVQYEARLQKWESDLILKQTELNSQIEDFKKARIFAEQMYSLPSEIIELNVGGEIFTTKNSTLIKASNSMLASLFSGQHPLSIDNDGHFFIDKDPKIFRMILNGLRSNVWYVPDSEDDKKNFENDMLYFGLTETPFKARLFYLGGSTNIFHKNVDCFNFNDEQWETMPSMLNSRGSFSSAFFNNKIYVFGGESNQGKFLSSIEVFDFTTQSWSFLTNMPFACSGMASVIINDSILLIGGEDETGSKVDTIIDFSFSTHKISFFDPLSSCRSDSAAIFYNDHVFVLGGISHNNLVLNNFEMLTSERKWKKMPNMPTSRFGFSSLAFNNSIYVIGGYDKMMQSLKTIDCFFPSNNHWKRLNTCPSSRGFSLSFTISGQMYVCGGWNLDTDTLCDTVEAYNPLTSMFTPLYRIPMPREAASIVVVSNGI